MCSAENPEDYLSYDLKLIQDPGLYVGLIDPPDCADFCNGERDKLGVTDTTCCLHARYWYSWYDLWAADCALIRVEAGEFQEEQWDESQGLYTTYSAFITQANVQYDGVTGGEISHVPDDYQVQNSPSDWKQNKKWNDGMFCDVNDPVADALMWDDSYQVNNRQKCWDFCSENRLETKATCCGMVFSTSHEDGTTDITCGLYFAELVERQVQSDEDNKIFEFYTAIKLGDGLRAKIEDAASLVQDTIDDWGNSAILLQAAAASTTAIMVATFA